MGRLLTLDPASIRTGYAVTTAGPALVEAGVLRPKRCVDTFERITAMADEVAALLLETEPRHILLEVPSGHMHVHKGGGAGLTIYGFAAGAVHRACVEYVRWRSGVRTWTVNEQTWTHGVRKEARAKKMCMVFRSYRACRPKDRGYDVADALGLADWWWRTYGTGGMVRPSDASAPGEG